MILLSLSHTVFQERICLTRIVETGQNQQNYCQFFLFRNVLYGMGEFQVLTYGFFFSLFDDVVFLGFLILFW